MTSGPPGSRTVIAYMPTDAMRSARRALDRGGADTKETGVVHRS
jgi:hypothetical protein